MKNYLGTKFLEATPMKLGAYNEFRGWTIPNNEDPEAEGFLVVYPDGYESWSPKGQFEKAYRETDGLSFGLAIEAMKKGFKVARTGWNSKGMFCIYVPGTDQVTFTINTPYAKALSNLADEHGNVHDQIILPHFDMYTINTEGRRAMLPGWLASQSDIAADDWQIVN